MLRLGLALVGHAESELLEEPAELLGHLLRRVPPCAIRLGSATTWMATTAGNARSAAARKVFDRRKAVVVSSAATGPSWSRTDCLACPACACRSPSPRHANSSPTSPR